ncbi:MAG: TIGR00730 family Rossman fold protein [Planctomycetota bacterium]|nr:MAG: TIGR00730 family Rossman fold protein [Planctomycetota bacterium]
MTLQRVCVFCGSRPGKDPRFQAAARELGAELVRRDLGLVFGGGSVGLMGVVADTVMEAGGEVIGVIPRELVDREVGHHELTELRIVDSMHERKHTMASLAEAFVAMPGGIGTLEELAEALTWNQLGIHAKPCGLLDVAGYWEPLRTLYGGFVEHGFLDEQALRFLVAEERPAALLDALASWDPVPVKRWKGPGAF